MALTVATNSGALMAQAAASSVNKSMENSMERLATGKRINSASDDAAGVAIASRLTAEIKGTNMAIRNAMDGQAMIDTAEGAHVEIENILQRMRELSVQSANDTNNAGDRANLQSEIDQLMTEIDRISSTTSWAGQSLLNGSSGSTSATSHTDQASFSFQVGSGTSSSDVVNTAIGATSSQALGLKGGGSSASSGPRTEGAAILSVNDSGVISVEGKLENNDVFTFDLNGAEISVTFSTADQFTDDLAGISAQIKEAIDTKVIAATDGFVGMTAVDNKDGSVTVTQRATVEIENHSFTTSGSTASTTTFANNTLTLGGVYEVADVVSVDVNGVTLTATATTGNAYSDSNTGLATQLADAIRTSAKLAEMGVVVTDNANGSLTFSQSTAPRLHASTHSPVDTDVTLTSADNKLTFGGNFVADKTFSATFFGKEVAITSSSSDGYADTLDGLAEQFTAKFNEVGVTGVSAAMATGGIVNFTTKAVVGDHNAAVGSGTIAAVDATTNSHKILLGGTQATGDKYEFSVNGEDFVVTLAADGNADTLIGLANQMVSAINDRFKSSGDVQATTAGTGSHVTITQNLALKTQDTNTTNYTSLTDVSVMDSKYAGPATATASSALVDVTSSTGATTAITKIDDALTTLNSQRANLGALSNRLDSTVSNLTNISSNLSAGRGRIEDADFAAETTNLAKTQILQQASTAMLAQANASKQGVLSLLQG
jgi:flagellin